MRALSSSAIVPGESAAATGGTGGGGRAGARVPVSSSLIPPHPGTLVGSGLYLGVVEEQLFVLKYIRRT